VRKAIAEIFWTEVNAITMLLTLEEMIAETE
jgi:hypothetical protein